MITIITPALNSENVIFQNMNSVKMQVYQDYEHIIIDGESVDSTISIINSFKNNLNQQGKLTLISEKDFGISDAFNKGIKIANGDVIAILNSDDCYIRDTLFGEIARIFTENPQIMFVHGDMVFKDDLFGSNTRHPLCCSLAKAMPYNHPTMFFRKDFYTKYGGFDLDFKFAMDFELISRMYKNESECLEKSFYFNKFPITIMNAGGTSYKNEIKALKECLLVLKKRNFLNMYSYLFYQQRILRVYLKSLLLSLNLTSVVRLWRKLKWQN